MRTSLDVDMMAGRDGGYGVLEYHLPGLVVALEMDHELVERINPARQLDAIHQKNRDLRSFTSQGVQELILQVCAGFLVIHDSQPSSW